MRLNLFLMVGMSVMIAPNAFAQAPWSSVQRYLSPFSTRRYLTPPPARPSWPQPTTQPSWSGPTAPPDWNSAMADLQIVRVQIVRAGGTWRQMGFTHEAIVWIRNNGNSTATGWSAGGSYQCLNTSRAGYRSGGISVIQGGCLVPGKTIGYRAPFRYLCDERQLTITFSVDPDNRVTESNEWNNTYQVRPMLY